MFYFCGTTPSHPPSAMSFSLRTITITTIHYTIFTYLYCFMWIKYRFKITIESKLYWLEHKKHFLYCRTRLKYITTHITNINFFFSDNISIFVPYNFANMSCPVYCELLVQWYKCLDIIQIRTSWCHSPVVSHCFNLCSKSTEHLVRLKIC